MTNCRGGGGEREREIVNETTSYICGFTSGRGGEIDRINILNS
jgi:hypothetical protein